VCQHCPFYRGGRASRAAQQAHVDIAQLELIMKEANSWVLWDGNSEDIQSVNSENEGESALPLGEHPHQLAVDIMHVSTTTVLSKIVMNPEHRTLENVPLVTSPGPPLKQDTSCT